MSSVSSPRLACLALAAAMLSMCGCAGVSGSADLAPANASLSLAVSADPSTIASGDSTTLQWSAQNATRVQISGLGTFPAQGSVAVSPAATTTYTAIAMAGGATMKKSVTVTVLPKTFLIVANHGPDNYYFSPSPLTESVSVYSVNFKDGSLSHLSGLSDPNLFTAGTDSFNIPPLVSADGRWVFILHPDGGELKTAEFALDKSSGALTSRQEVSPDATFMIASDPAAPLVLLWSQSGELLSMRIEGNGALEALGSIPLPAPCMSSKFDSSGTYFLCAVPQQTSQAITELFRVDGASGNIISLGPLPSQAAGTMPLGFDASGKHILTFQRSSSQSGYSEQILVFDFDAAHGVATFNNSNLVIPPHSSDANPLLLSGELLFSRNGQGLVSSYELDSSKGTLGGPVASFSVNSDFTIPYIADGITDTLISLGMQSNNVASFRLNMTDGTLQNSNGPYQAGSAPEFMAVAHQ